MLRFTKKTIITKLITEEQHGLKNLRYWSTYHKDLNKNGYRSDEFNVPHDISVVTVGCSNGFGWAIDKKQRFSDIFVSNLTEYTGKRIANWNLSIPAKSNDYISRTVLSLPHILNPDILLVAFTCPVRREYFDINFDLNNMSKCYNHLPKQPKVVKEHYPEFMGTYRKFMKLSSPHEDYLNFYKNYKLVEMTCQLHNIRLLFSISIFPEFENADLCTNEKLYVGNFDIIDHATDETHPGPKSNQLIADRFWEKYKDVYLG